MLTRKAWFCLKEEEGEMQEPAGGPGAQIYQQRQLVQKGTLFIGSEVSRTTRLSVASPPTAATLKPTHPEAPNSHRGGGGWRGWKQHCRWAPTWASLGFSLSAYNNPISSLTVSTHYFPLREDKISSTLGTKRAFCLFQESWLCIGKLTGREGL